MNLPICRQRGIEVGDNEFVCFSDRLIHKGSVDAGICLICPYVDRENREASKEEKVKFSIQKCIHRGNELRVQECKTCGGSVKIKIFECSKHQECTILKRIDKNISTCFSCEDHKPEFTMNWAYGVTTVLERVDDLLPKTLESLKAGGFDNPRLFVDGEKDDSAFKHFGLEVTTRYPTIRTHGNWILSLYELYIRNPNADRYAVFQDDFITYKGLREYLEHCEYPEKGYFNCYTFPRNQHRAPKNKTGWYLSDQLGKGAVALIFSHAAIEVLLTAQHMWSRPQNAKRGWRAVDGGIVDSFKKAGWREYVHNPSLVQHTGDKSSMGNRKHALATSFRGVDFDARSLL